MLVIELSASMAGQCRCDAFFQFKEFAFNKVQEQRIN